MNDYIAELTLDLDCRNTFPTVRAGQYDKGRKILIHITANSQTYSATGCTAIIKGRRQDKTYFSASCTVDSSGNVELTINEEVLAVRGFAYAKIVLSDATRNYSTQIFVIDVDVALEGNVTEVESFSVFNDCLNQLAALFGLNNAQQILAQYLTTNDISLFERRIDPEEIGVVPLNVQTQQPDYTSSQFAQLLNGQVFICSEDPDYHYNGNINELREWNDSLTIWLKISEYNSDLGPIAKQIPLGNNYVPTTTKIAGISLGSDIGAPALRQALSTGKVSTVSSVPTTATVGNVGDVRIVSQTVNNVTTYSIYRCVDYIHVEQGASTYVWKHIATVDDLDGKVDKTQKVAGLALNGDISKDDLVESIIGKINPPQINPASSTGYPAQYGKTADGTPVFCSGMNVWEELAKLEDVPYSINDLSDGTIAVRKFNADTDGDAPPNSAPPSNAVTAHYPVPCLWYHGGDVWFVYAISTSTVGGVPYYTYTSVQLTNEQDISGKENTSNKVTVLSAQSTNAQYPSAKCVYDAVSSVDPPLLVQIEYDENLGQYASDKTTQEIAAKFPNVTFVLETVTCLTGYCEPSNHIYTIYVLGLFNGYDPMVSAYSGRRNGSTDKLVFTQTGRVFNSAYAEKWSNRVSVLNAQSTEYTYPNAKCVYDALALKANTSAIPKRTSQLANDSGFLTAHQDISGKMDLAPEVSSTGGQLAQPPGQLYRGTGNDVYLKTGAQGSSTDNIRLVAYDDLKVFMVNLTMNTYHGRPSSYNDAYYNADKTIDEIKAAVLAGKEVIFRADYVTYVNSYQDYILDHTYLYFTLSRTIIPEPGAYGFDPSTICAYCITFGTVEENFAYSVLHLHWIGNEWRASKVSEQA